MLNVNLWQHRSRSTLTLSQVTDTESYRDLQQSYLAYNFVTKLEIRTVKVLSRPYNQGTYGRCAGMTRRPLTVWLVQCSNNSVPIWPALFSPVCPHPGLAWQNDRIAWELQQEFFFCVWLILISTTCFAMSCRPLEESAQDPESPNPVTPTQPPRSAGACHYNPDAKNLECQRQIAFVCNACRHWRVCGENRQWRLHWPD
jgi:hypothetical protein